ncbi:MAG: methyl-accepting chemotaxis protein [Defluviitaleaceae bacterium]|nr:methyl-accepting chemotaxis protein [Defluviitaleaceae bacterium]
MKLRTKIVGGFLCIFLLAVVLGAYSVFTIARINNINHEIQVLTELSDEVDDLVDAHHIWRYNLAWAFLYDREFNGGLNPHACVYGVWLDGEMSGWVNDAQLNALIEAIFEPHYAMHVQGGIALQLREEGRMDEALELLYTVVFPAATESTQRITALSHRYNELRDGYIDTLDSFVLWSMIIIIVLCIVAFVAFLVLSGLLTHGILKPIRRLVQLTSDVTAGRLSFNRVRNIPADEIGELTNNMYELADLFRGMVDGFSKMEHEYNVVGDVEYRVDTSGYQNAYKEMTDAVYKIIDGQSDVIDEIIKILDQINDGNFHTTIKDLPGKKAILPQTLRAVTANLKNVTNGVGTMVEAASLRGELQYRIDVSKYNGDWCEIMIGLNNIAEAVNHPLSEIRDVMSRVNAATFDTKVTGDYKGDFLAIKNDVNQVIDSLSTYIHEIKTCLNALAAGDLTYRLTMKFDGEFSQIEQSIKNINESLYKTMSEISTASNQVLGGAKQISASSIDLAQGAATQASSVEELNSMIELLNQQIQQNATSATEAGNMSHRSTENAKEGNAAMLKTLDAMNQIKDASSNISKINKSIQDIAFQTNLLALNAAVEAARAGEHGKGFAVVADEVRNLAARSQAAAAETTQLISTSLDTVEIGSEIAKSTATALDTIVSNAGNVRAKIGEITASTTDQENAISQAVQGLFQISQVVQSNSASSEETAAAAQELTSQAEVLQQMVSFFKL